MSIESISSIGLENCPPVIVGEPLPLVVALDRVKAEDVPRVGGKGANLGALLAAGLPVPRGFCITTAAFQQFVDSCREIGPLCAALGAIGRQQIGKAQTLAAQLRQRLSAARLPPAVERAVVAAWHAQGTHRAYAVRSSATAEDQPHASFAGQGETFLNVRGREAILHSVRACWVSLFADRAVLYRMHNHIEHRTAAMAVVVQELIAADVSGVLFTVDPVSGNTQRMVIEAVYGLGPALVSGEVSPDRLVLSRPELQVLERYVGKKAIEIVPDGSPRLRRHAVDSQRARAACLDAATARRLGLLALQAERALGGPQDMEWAVKAERLFLLQSRPVTTLERQAGQPQTVWSNMNSWEVLPGVLTPMSWSVASLQLQCLFSLLLEILGIERAPSAGMSRQPIFGLIAGRAYANLNTLARIIRAVPGLARLDFAEGLGGEHAELLSGLIRQESAGERESAGNWRQRLRRAVRFLRFAVWCVVHAADQRGAHVLTDFRGRVDRLAGSHLAAKSDAELLDHLGALFYPLQRYGPDMAASVAVATSFVRFFFNFIKGRAGHDGGTIANRMLGGLNGLASAEAGLDLWRLAAWTGRQPRLRAMVAEAADFESLRRRLAGSGDDEYIGREFLARWDQFMLHHGHHACGELDVYNPRWSETPALVLDLLRSYVNGAAGADPQEFQQRLAKQRRGLARDFRRQLRNPLQREVFDFLFRKAQGGIALRENARNEIVRLLAAVRRALLELGDRLARRGVLLDRDDIFFVELSELRPLVAGDALGGKIAARKAEFAYYRSIVPPPVVVGQFDPRQCAAETARPATRVLHGLAVSAGVATGPARVMLRPQGGQPIEPGEILIAPCTDPGWTPYFLAAAGIVMDVGGMLSHGSIVAREYGIPAVVNVGSATQGITTGQMVRVDGDRGVVTVL